MDTQLVTEKILTFCKEKYPDLKWVFHGFDYDQYHQTIQGVTDSSDSSEMEILLFIGDGCWSDGYREGWEGIKGWCTLNSLDWIGEFIVLLNSNKKSDFCFYSEDIDEWNEKDWVSCKQIQKIMLDIFTFILDEVQE
ncbi:hypothetical protein MaMV-DH010158 [Cyanophage MaMV-DH01]|nr:hypothetical protein MaMV-DH010158 [Cyanophage MaMV-DH01]